MFQIIFNKMINFNNSNNMEIQLIVILFQIHLKVLNYKKIKEIQKNNKVEEMDV